MKVLFFLSKEDLLKSIPPEQRSENTKCFSLKGFTYSSWKDVHCCRCARTNQFTTRTTQQDKISICQLCVTVALFVFQFSLLTTFETSLLHGILKDSSQGQNSKPSTNSYETSEMDTHKVVLKYPQRPGLNYKKPWPNRRWPQLVARKKKRSSKCWKNQMALKCCVVKECSMKQSVDIG